MDTKAAILALMSVWGVGTCATLPANAQDVDGAAEDAVDDVGDSELVLNLKLGEEVQEQRFTVADVPYVCPDMVK